ncbi:enoyl-CoA hydratase/isomerase family protein [Kurthia zopfii]|uniref:enoyl-CoA hydratase/isomerase family protein n=1 Tax=Kurthia zopfii TaxID=1650 RepID=UPI000F70BE32|nr:enoyl-CoA hydratase/isomerase family protein [Kurthia zopfii]VEI04797.1 Probable enoyl-CoA hydratase echA8 [Kurthia zopfii]
MTYTIDETDGVLVFTLNRPERRNAINTELMEGFKKVIEYVHNSNSVRFLVITGAGEKAFCSGGDLAEFHSLKTEQQAFGMLSKMAEILYEWATLPVPTIALINGAAVGGGCEIATACDFRVVAREAKCGFIQGTLAITSGWGGATFLFERGLRHDRALKMLIDAQVYDSGQLEEVGWATKVYDGDRELALAHFIEYMRTINPGVHKAYKEIEIRKWAEKDLKKRVMEEVSQCSKLWELEAHHEAVNRFLKK